MLKVRLYFLSVIGCFFLGGCASPYKMSEQVAAPSSLVRIKILGDSYFIGAVVHTDGVCKGKRSLGQTIGAEGQWVKKGYAEKPIFNMLDTPVVASTKQVERKFPANQPLILNLKGNGGAFSSAAGLGVNLCEVLFSFTPEANYQYEITYHWGREGCSVNVNEMQLLDNKVSRTVVQDLKTLSEYCP